MMDYRNFSDSDMNTAAAFMVGQRAQMPSAQQMPLDVSGTVPPSWRQIINPPQPQIIPTMPSVPPPPMASRMPLVMPGVENNVPGSTSDMVRFAGTPAGRSLIDRIMQMYQPRRPAARRPRRRSMP